MGWEEKVGAGIASITNRLNFAGNSFTKTRPMILPAGGDGNIDPTNNRARYGTSTIAGTLTLEPTAAELAFLLPWIYGATNTGTSFPLGQTFVGYLFAADKKQAVLNYTGVKVGSAVFEVMPNQPMRLTLNLLGLTETPAAAGTFPSLTADASTNYFVLPDGIFVANSLAVCSEFFRLTIDNGMTYAPMTNCQTGPAAIIATQRTITLEFLPGYTTEAAALYPPADAGWACNATFTNGAISLNWDFANVKFEHIAPSAAAMTEYMKLPLRGRAMRTSGAAALVTTLDSTN